MRSYLSLSRLLLAIGLSLPLGLSPRAACATEPGPTISLANMTSEYNLGHYPMAQYIGCQLLRREPSNLAVHYLLGNLYVKFAMLDKAQGEYSYCARTGTASEIGRFANQALQQLIAMKNAPAPKPSEGETADCPPESKDLIDANIQPPGPPPDKVDLETLEYKERLLKTGADMIAANRIKLQRQVEAEQKRTNDALDNYANGSPGRGFGFGNPFVIDNTRQRLQMEGAARVKQLEDQNEQEEKRITAYYQAQADKIGSQKTSLTSQALVGHGDVRLQSKGSGLFVRNYINFHGEVPLPPPPPELKATALKLNSTTPPKKKSN